MRSARIITPLLPASITHTAGISPNSLRSPASRRGPAAAMLRAATLACSSVGKPVFGTPTGTAVCHGSCTAAATPTE